MNPAFEPIEIELEDADALWVIGTAQALVGPGPCIADPLPQSAASTYRE